MSSIFSDVEAWINVGCLKSFKSMLLVSLYPDIFEVTATCN